MDERLEKAKFAFGYNKYIAAPERKSSFVVNIMDDYIYVNKDGVVKEENNKDVLAKVEEIVMTHLQEIIKMSDKVKNLQRIKYTGGDNMKFKVEGALYSLTNDVADEEVKSLYSVLKEQILALLVF